MSITSRQRVAITRPCRLAGETVHSRYKLLLPVGVSSIVTINNGYE